MMEVILGKLGEAALKGDNRRTFERILAENTRKAVAPFGAFDVHYAQSTFYIKPLEENCDVTGAYEAVKGVFGFTAVSRALGCEKTEQGIAELLRTRIAPLVAHKTFKVESRRSDKSFPLKSPQLSAMAGGVLLESSPGARVDVHQPQVTVFVEVREEYAFIHAGAERGAGGLPVGTGGKAMLLLSGGIDSPVAGYMTAKRGLRLCAVHFFSFPYTGERAKQKVMELAQMLAARCGGMTLCCVPFTRVQETIRDHCREELFTIVMRRFMMQISTRLAYKEHCRALVTGESLGQVASQTIDAIRCTDDATSMPVFRPLIGLDKMEIIERARAFGSLEVSERPYEDCCTVFTPRHPELRPKLEEIRQVQEQLPWEELVEEAVRATEFYKF